MIEEVKKEDGGVFACTPFNKWQGVKKEARLTVLSMYCIDLLLITLLKDVNILYFSGIDKLFLTTVLQL